MTAETVTTAQRVLTIVALCAVIAACVREFAEQWRGAR
jgi:hypothetical protein